MNNPSPFASPGSPTEQKNSTRGRVRLAVFCILSVHIVALMTMLMIGCRRQEAELIPAPEPTNLVTETSLEMPTNTDTTLPTNQPYVPPAVETNPPAPTTWTPPPAALAGREYTIVKGDSFASIAKKFPGVSVRQIQEANPTAQPTRLKIGQKIQIPAPSVGTATSPIAAYSESPAASAGLYTVKSGDTLTTIAKKQGTSVKALRSANNLVTDKIRIGQKLKLPSKASSPAPVEPAPVVTPEPAAYTTPTTTNL
ncbi:MAG: LysM peptidoglycan-binding domain-containing protein [Akkermansiaceae bacterium]|nr:LysM peptidoglycan-binding domain-containing protein [Verrucomicrobiales bacterium]